MVKGLGFNGITTMQEMTSSICSNATPGLEGRLRDTRDDKVYWIGKLKDGNCWMTQNLDLDLSTSKALTSAESDVANWTPGYSTQTSPSGWGSTGTYQKSYDPGNYYYTTPTIQNACTNNSTGLSACTGNDWKLNATNADIAGLVDVSDWTATYDTYFVSATNYVGTDGLSICNKTKDSIFGDSTYLQCRIYYDGGGYSKTYEHYHAGNYYSYAAAAAGSAPSGSGLAGSSICPKGWRLPLSGESNNSVSGSFYNLVNGLTVAQITASPYYFVYGGSVYSSSLNYAGSWGYLWSSTAYSSTGAYYLFFGTIVNPSNDSSTNYRYFGFSVRCVAR